MVIVELVSQLTIERIVSLSVEAPATLQIEGESGVYAVVQSFGTSVVIDPDYAY